MAAEAALASNAAGTSAAGASSAINLAGGAIGAWVSGHYAKKLQSNEQAYNSAEAEIARRWNEDMMDKANAWNREQWELENEYNDPANQFKRLVNAGLSPSAAAQAIGVNPSSTQQSANASGSPAPTSPSIAGDIGNIIGGTWSDFWRNELLKSQVEGQNIENNFAPAMNEARIKECEASIREKLSSGALNEARATEISEMLPLLKNKTQTEILDIQKKWDLLIQEIEVAKANVQKIEAETATEEQRTKFVEQQTKESKERTDQTQYENIVKKVEARLAEDFGILPNSDKSQMIVQGVLSGHGDDVIKATCQTALDSFNASVEVGKKAVPIVKQTAKKVWHFFRRKR